MEFDVTQARFGAALVYIYEWLHTICVCLYIYGDVVLLSVCIRISRVISIRASVAAARIRLRESGVRARVWDMPKVNTSNCSILSR